MKVPYGSRVSEIFPSSAQKPERRKWARRRRREGRRDDAGKWGHDPTAQPEIFMTVDIWRETGCGEGTGR